MKVKTKKISELIENLQLIKNDEGDLPVVFATDDEGHSYNTLGSKAELEYDTDYGVLVIYPASEIDDLSDIAGMRKNNEGEDEEYEDEYTELDFDNEYDE